MSRPTFDSILNALRTFPKQKIECFPWQVAVLGESVLVLPEAAAKELTQKIKAAGLFRFDGVAVSLDGLAIVVEGETESHLEVHDGKVTLRAWKDGALAGDPAVRVDLCDNPNDPRKCSEPSPPLS